MKSPPEVQITHSGSLIKVEVHSWTDESGRKVVREVVRHPGAVVVVPVLDDGRVVMIRNYRLAVDDRLWELPAGKLEAREEPAEAAGRELDEETGCRAGKIIRLGEFFTSPGFADELIHLYLARQITRHEQRLEPGEDISVEIMTLDQALDMIKDGQIRDGKTIAGLLMYATFYRDQDS